MKRKITLACLLVLSLLIVLTACKANQDTLPSDIEQTSTEEESSAVLPEESTEQEEPSAALPEQSEKQEDEPSATLPEESVEQEEETSSPESEQPTAEEEEESEKMMQMRIDDVLVNVEWEDNESVEALKALCENEPLVIQMSMYGGFEQVGPIGQRLPSDDVQTTTAAGDIVLYSSSQIVVFYGSNSWAYTRLGHITDQDASAMATLLGNGDVTITISLEEVK